MPESRVVEIPIGDRRFSVPIPNLIGVAEPEHTPGVPDKREEIIRALEAPIGSPKLEELARGKHSAAIVINDITRPYPGGLMVEELARRLNAAGIPDERISLIVAYGMHRPNTMEELGEKYGAGLLRRFPIVHHDASDPEKNLLLGYTEGGVEVCINRSFAQAEVRIVTGCIAPHQFAGFSGGRKSVLPGIASLETIRRHHSFPIRPEVISLGLLVGNRFHKESLAAARIAKVDFILNAVENTGRELVRCVAGDLEEAWLAGVEISRKIWTVAIPERPDIVVVSPGGYPRDFDLHQSQKALGCAEMVCPDGGGVILCARCMDGAGKPGKLLREAKAPQELIDRFLRNGLEPSGTGKAYMLARSVTKFHVVLAGSAIPGGELREMFLDGYGTVEQALAHMLERYGQDARVLVIPNASEIIPVVEQKKGG